MDKTKGVLDIQYKKIPSEIDLAPRYKLLTLLTQLTLLTWFTLLTLLTLLIQLELLYIAKTLAYMPIYESFSDMGKFEYGLPAKF